VDSIGKLLLGPGLVLLATGIAVLLLSRYGVHKLPGDIIIRRGHFTLYLPLGLMILLSLVLTIAPNLLSRRSGSALAVPAEEEPEYRTSSRPQV